MAASPDRRRLDFRSYPQPFFVDIVRWLPAASPFERLLAAAVHDADTSSSSLRILSLPNTNPNPKHLASLPFHSRITALRASPSGLLAAATFSGDLRLLSVAEGESAAAIAGGEGFHAGPVRGLDEMGGDGGWVTAGEDGRVHLVGAGEGRTAVRRVHDSRGMTSYAAAKSASPAEFATGGPGGGVQWWDQRKGGGVVAQCKGIWGRGIVTGMVHSIDIHPSRKHICVVGGSSGTIFAWDLRLPQQPILLSGVGVTGTVRPAAESDVWEVLFDNYTLSSGILSSASTRILPVMMCSEDGFLAVAEQDERPVTLLEERCAINSFDIEPQNPSDVVCALEWESIGVLMRGRDMMATTE